MTDTVLTWNDPALRLARAIMLLSLDYTRPFLGVMGLTVRGDFAWTNCARGFIREYRQQFYTQVGTGGMRQLPDAVDYTSRHLGTVAAGVLGWWLDNVYAEAPRDHFTRGAWESVLNYLDDYPPGWESLAWPPGLAQPTRERFRATVFARDLDPLWAAASEQRLSDWDLHLYAVQGWNDDLPDAPNGAESQVYAVARSYRFLVFCDEFASELAPGDQERLRASAQRVVDATSDLAYVGTLPPMAALRAEWP